MECRWYLYQIYFHTMIYPTDICILEFSRMGMRGRLFKGFLNYTHTRSTGGRTIIRAHGMTPPPPPNQYKTHTHAQSRKLKNGVTKVFV